MKRPYIFFTVVCLLFGITINAQTFQISGKITGNSDMPVEFAEIFLTQNDTIKIVEMSEENGNFSVFAPPGTYILYIRLLGDTLFFKNIFLNQNIDLQTIKIENTAKALQEVTIVARRKMIERKADRLIFNIENSITASGGTVLDALKITPRLSVDNRGNIEMIGKSGMKLLIDERDLQLSGEDLVNYLKSIPAENIQSIEVITNPPARYTAEGNSGIVNIRLKHVLPNSWSANMFGLYRQSEYGQGNAGGRFACQKNKITFSTNLNFNYGSSGVTETQTIYYPVQTFYNEQNSNDLLRGFGGRMLFDYQISKKIKIGVQYAGTFSKPEKTGINIGYLTDSTDDFLEKIKTDLQNLQKNTNSALNFHTIYNIDSAGKKLMLDADCFIYSKNNSQVYSANNVDNQDVVIPNTFSSKNNTGQQNVRNYAVNIEMQHPLKWLKLIYGGKISFTKTRNYLKYYDLSSGVSVPENNQNNNFEFTENTQALFFSAEKKINEKWNLQLGLRMENTQTEGNSLTINKIDKNNYIQFFPTAYITCTPNENHSFSLNYGKRISRPRFSMLNPFRSYYTPYSYFEGNPFLRPSNMHNVELGYTLQGNFNISASYSTERNGYALLILLEQNSTNQVISMLNYYNSDDYSITIDYIFDKINWLESYISGNAGYSKTIAFNPNVPELSKGWKAFLVISNTFAFNSTKTLMGSFNINYSFPKTYHHSKYKGALYSEAGIRYLLLKKQLAINLTVTDIFRTNYQKWNVTNNNIPMYCTNYSDMQAVTISISYRFGNNKISVRESKTGNTEEKGRI
jgi:hypothetical protein